MRVSAILQVLCLAGLLLMLIPPLLPLSCVFIVHNPLVIMMALMETGIRHARRVVFVLLVCPRRPPPLLPRMQQSVVAM